MMYEFQFYIRFDEESTALAFFQNMEKAFDLEKGSYYMEYEEEKEPYLIKELQDSGFDTGGIL